MCSVVDVVLPSAAADVSFLSSSPPHAAPTSASTTPRPIIQRRTVLTPRSGPLARARMAGLDLLVARARLVVLGGDGQLQGPLRALVRGECLAQRGAPRQRVLGRVRAVQQQ